jgi:hypothetical protein
MNKYQLNMNFFFNLIIFITVFLEIEGFDKNKDSF